jgi:hypothetical protein
MAPAAIAVIVAIPAMSRMIITIQKIANPPIPPETSSRVSSVSSPFSSCADYFSSCSFVIFPIFTFIRIS